MSEIIIENIQHKIYTIQDKQVLLDIDLAKLYQIETKVFNQAVKRNIKRFPEHFRFQLKECEYDYILKSQIVTSRLKQHGGRRYLPYVFTEQGVSMLSAILKSDIAIEISIKIIDAFVHMRQFLISNNLVFQKLDIIEHKLLKYDNNFDKVFKALENKKVIPSQGIFYNGQIYDAYVYINDIFKTSQTTITLIDNYIDDTVLTIFSKYPKLQYTIITKKLSKQLNLDISKYNSQYNNLKIKLSNKYHDRFLIIDNKEVYHIGASLKDLGKKIFAFSRIDKNVLKDMLV